MPTLQNIAVYVRSPRRRQEENVSGVSIVGPRSGRVMILTGGKIEIKWEVESE
jgi:hypothetical protein